MPQSLLRTPRIRLEPLSDAHLEFEVALDADPEVMRYLGSGQARDRAEVEEAHRGRLASAEVVAGLGFWAGFVADEFVGWWLLEPPDDPDPAQAELGYRLLRRFWRQGLASEGSRELLRHGFTDLGLERIFARTKTVNAASRATMASVGMRYVRTLGFDVPEPGPGGEFGAVEYAITRQEWMAT